MSHSKETSLEGESLKLFKHLTTDQLNDFLGKKVNFQGHDVKISKLTKNIKVLEELYQQKSLLEIGKMLPSEKIPKIYFNRIFLKISREVEEEIEEDAIFEFGKNVIIEGIGGIGKTVAMIKQAEDVKKKHPDFFIQYVDLKRHTNALEKYKESFDAWQFVLNHLIDFQEKMKEFRLNLIEAFLEEEQPRIVIFLDGFDEISPLYTENVIEIIKKLKQKKVQMFVASQSNLEDILHQLEFENYYKIEPFVERIQREFLRQTWKEYVNQQIASKEIEKDQIDVLHVNIFTKKFLKMCQKSKLTETILSTPLMLNILANIYAEECLKFCSRSFNRQANEFLEIDILNIYERIFRDNLERNFPAIAENTIEEWHQIYMNLASKNLLKYFFYEENSPNVKESDIYGGGFITGRSIGECIFIYDTVEEFFAADWFTRKIFQDGGGLNVELLKNLLRKDAPKKDLEVPKGIQSFAYRFVLRRLREFRKNGNLGRITDADRMEISEFIIGFFSHAWYNQETNQLETIFELAKIFCADEEVRDVCRSRKLLEGVPFTSSAQLELSLQIYDHYFSPEDTNTILSQRNLEKIMELILRNTNYPLFESSHKVLTGRKIYTEEDFLDKTFDCFEKFLLKQNVKGWMFAKELFWWFFHHKHTTQKEILAKMEKILKEDAKNPKFQGRHLLGHLITSFWDLKAKQNDEQNEREFVKELFSQLEASKDYYKFLYAINCTTREDFLVKSIEAMRQNGCRFICHDGKSILCHAFEDSNGFLLQNLMKVFTREEIEEQIGTQVCSGKSLMRQCTKENFLCEVFLQGLVNKYGDRVTELCFTPIAADATATEENVKIFATFFRKDMKVDESILQGLVRRLCDECSVENFMEFVVTERGTEPVTEYILKYLLKTKSTK